MRVLLPRGEGSMKGAVKTNISPPTGCGNIFGVAASLTSVETIRCSGVRDSEVVRHCVVRSLKLKSDGAGFVADHGSI